uniref:Uncharacterized protein n=1 Tax=Megaselia scalaris TaxID=36166 RepID=T1GAW0_MEGSC
MDLVLGHPFRYAILLVMMELPLVTHQYRVQHIAVYIEVFQLLTQNQAVAPRPAPKHYVLDQHQTQQLMRTQMLHQRLTTTVELSLPVQQYRRQRIDPQ